MRTVVILPNWVGDTVLALPVLETLSKAGRRSAVLARPHLGPLLEPLPSVAEVIPRASSMRDTIEELRARHFEEAVILPNSFRSGWLPFRARIPRRWGYRGRSLESLLRALLLRPAVVRPACRRHQAADYAELLAAMDISAPENWTPRLPVSGEQHAHGRMLLERARLEPARPPLVGLFAGAESGPAKRWPWRRFAELARALRRRVPASQQVIVAGPKEVWLAVRIHEESGKIHPVVGPDLDLGQLACVLAQLDLLVTNDSGPMHMAAALGVACVAIFGPTTPRRTRPIGDLHQVVYSDRWCSPCFRRRCPLLHHRCMRDIAVDDVLERCLQMLAT